MRATEILLKCLVHKDGRSLRLLEPDRKMVLGFNLGRLIESPDVDERRIGLTMALLFLTRHDEILISDICSDEQVQARDTIHKRQSMAIFECLRDLAGGRNGSS